MQLLLKPETKGHHAYLQNGMTLEGSQSVTLESMISGAVWFQGSHSLLNRITQNNSVTKLNNLQMTKHKHQEPETHITYTQTNHASTKNQPPSRHYLEDLQAVHVHPIKDTSTGQKEERLSSLSVDKRKKIRSHQQHLLQQVVVNKNVKMMVKSSLGTSNSPNCCSRSRISVIGCDSACKPPQWSITKPPQIHSISLESTRPQQIHSILLEWLSMTLY